MTQPPPTWTVVYPSENFNYAWQNIEIAQNLEPAAWLVEALRKIGDAGLTRILVEGGAMLGTAFLRARLVDRLYWFRAPIVIGGEGLPGIAPLEIDRLADSVGLRCTGRRTLGNDVLELYDRPA